MGTTLRAELRGTNRYRALRRARDRFWIAHLYLRSVSLYLTTPFLRCNCLVPALVAVEVESRESARRPLHSEPALQPTEGLNRAE